MPLGREPRGRARTLGVSVPEAASPPPSSRSALEFEGAAPPLRSLSCFSGLCIPDIKVISTKWFAVTSASPRGPVRLQAAPSQMNLFRKQQFKHIGEFQ